MGCLRRAAHLLEELRSSPTPCHRTAGWVLTPTSLATAGKDSTHGRRKFSSSTRMSNASSWVAMATGAIPPDAVAAACPRDTSPPSGNWPYPVYATDPTTPISTCSGAGTEGCLYSKPGVWIGSAQISPFLGSLRHTATLVVNNNGIKITELQISGAQDTIFFERPVPASHGIEDFIWVRVASPAWFDAVRSAALRATWEYTDRIYFGDSGRFTSSILKAAGIVLSKEQQAALGNSPGICWCFTCLQP
jgi:hypothetical protein